MFKMLAEHKNNNRLGRKPIPDELKLKFAQESKEYHAYKIIENEEIDREKSILYKNHMKAMDSIIYLPDYLLEECFQDSGEVHSQDMMEFVPSVLYMEQILRVWP